MNRFKIGLLVIFLFLTIAWTMLDAYRRAAPAQSPGEGNLAQKVLIQGKSDVKLNAGAHMVCNVESVKGRKFMASCETFPKNPPYPSPTLPPYPPPAVVITVIVPTVTPTNEPYPPPYPPSPTPAPWP